MDTRELKEIVRDLEFLSEKFDTESIANLSERIEELEPIIQEIKKIKGKNILISSLSGLIIGALVAFGAVYSYYNAQINLISAFNPIVIENNDAIQVYMQKRFYFDEDEKRIIFNIPKN